MKNLIGSLSSLGAMALPLFVLAQALPPTGPPTIPTQFTSIVGFQVFLCTVVVGWMFTFLVVLSIVFVLVAAFKYLTSAGEPERVKSAGYTLLYAMIAVVVALFARAIPLLVDSIIGGGGSTRGIC